MLLQTLGLQCANPSCIYSIYNFNYVFMYSHLCRIHVCNECLENCLIMVAVSIVAGEVSVSVAGVGHVW